MAAHLSVAGKVEVNKPDTFAATVLCTLSQMGARWLRLRTPPTLGLATLKGDTDIEHTCVFQHSESLVVVDIFLFLFNTTEK